MTRRLLPYEHQLITELGISKDEYLDFLQAQFDHTRLPADKLTTPQADFGVVALVLTIVGTLVQVGAALLAPKPEIPGQDARRTRREQVFAPRFGFNSQQELAKYGDTVNLVYGNTADNTLGGVRVATSLIWSAVRSEGSSQFMQTLLAIGASQIQQISAERIAFGQTPIRQMSTTRTWAYFGHNAPLRYSSIFRPTGSTTDPTRIAASSNDFVYRACLEGDQYSEGFSQAFSPSTMTRCGIYAPIPINVNYYDRDEDGKRVRAELGIELQDASTYWPRDVLNDTRVVVPVGTTFTLVFKEVANTYNGNDVKEAAAELRRSLSSFMDSASTYKLGSAVFRVAAPIKNVELDADDMSVKLECIESGICPTEDYGTTNFKQNEDEANNEIVLLKQQVAALNAQLLKNDPILKPGIGTGAITRLNEINAIIESIEDLRDRRWTAAELDAIVNDDGDIYDDRVNPFATKVLNTRASRDNERNSIEEWQDEISVERKSANTSQAYIEKRKQWIREARSRIATLSKRLRNQQSKLDWAIREYGFNTAKGGNLRSDRKVFLKKQAKLQEEIASLYGDANNIDTAAMATRNANLQSQITTKQARITYLNNYLKNPEKWNDWFHVKCLVKVEEAKYETITACRVVDFALKARVFKRVQGRAKTYGEVTMENYKLSDNGIKLRSMMFWVWYRPATTPEQAWQRVPRIFVVRRAADVDNFISLKFIADTTDTKWQFRFEPIADTGAEMGFKGAADFAYIENSGDVRSITVPGGKFTFLGRLRSRRGLLPYYNVNPSEIDEWSLFSMFSDTQLAFSFDQGPELALTAVTEQRTETFSTYPNLYNGLTLLGFNTYSGQGVQDLRSISVFAEKGKAVRRLRDDGSYPSTPDAASSYAPDIFLDTILDTQNGIGRFAKVEGIDLQALAIAKRFCQRNSLFMDGVIADQTPWRQFWAEVAPFSLLELGRIGGKETLVPAVPCDNAGNITRSITITALFNQGNILEDSYKEEFIDYGSSVQDLIASVIYRDTEIDGVFPRNNSVEISRIGVTESDAVRQTFDISQFVTRRDQAIKYGKLICNQRRHIRRAIEFSTFPTNSVLSPGAYIYVAIGENTWDQVKTGTIAEGGALNTPVAGSVPNGTYSALLYQTGSAPISLSGVTVTNNTASTFSSYPGWLFVLGQSVTNKRVFRITEVQMDEEGEVNVKAVEHPCDVSGSQTLSRIADFSDANFTIR